MLNFNSTYELYTVTLQDLNRYLSKNRYEIANSEPEAAKISKEHPHSVYTYIEEYKKYVVVYGCSNHALSCERVAHMLIAVTDITRMMNTLKNNAENCDDNYYKDKIDYLKQRVEKVRHENTYLNARYSKTHLSYQQNRDLGRSIISSLWHTTLFQSRANTALETALKRIETFLARHPVLTVSNQNTYIAKK